MRQEEIISTLRSIGAAPIKQLGQHFLVCDNALETIVKAANISLSDNIIEIGPGLGVLTIRLVKKGGKIVSVEKDTKYSTHLRKSLAAYPNFFLVHNDVLKINIPELLKSRFGENMPDYKIVANLPYNIASKIIRLFLETECPPKAMVLLVQKEVGERICAHPPHMNQLACLIQLVARPEMIGLVRPDCFYPVPAVTSAIIRLTNIRTVKNDHRNSDNRLTNIIRGGFRSPRKTLANNLSSFLKIDRAEIESLLTKIGKQKKVRPAELTVEEWRKISKALSLFSLDKK